MEIIPIIVTVIMIWLIIGAVFTAALWETILLEKRLKGELLNRTEIYREIIYSLPFIFIAPFLIFSILEDVDSE
jgi:hypothetical protein